MQAQIEENLGSNIVINVAFISLSSKMMTISRHLNLSSVLDEGYQLTDVPYLLHQRFETVIFRAFKCSNMTYIQTTCVRFTDNSLHMSLALEFDVAVDDQQLLHRNLNHQSLSLIFEVVRIFHQCDQTNETKDVDVILHSLNSPVSLICGRNQCPISQPG